MNISQILDRINEHTKLLSSGQISEIERDILLGDLRELYLLAKGQAPVEQPVVIIPSVAEVKEVIVPVIEKVEAPVIIEVVKQEPVIVPTPEPVVEVKPEVVPVAEVIKEVTIAPPFVEVKKEVAPVIAEVKEEPVHLETKRIHYHEGSPVRGPKVSSLNEVYVGEEKSINTIVGGAEKKRVLNDHVAGKDLNSMLDLNKKHVLTNELFNGDSAAFQAAIAYINTSPNIETAFEYIKTQLLPVYQWKGDQQSTKLFDKLVRQKFGV
jgi:hypothetical protein